MKKQTSIRKTGQLVSPYHVIPLGTGWAVKAAGQNRFGIITETKREAMTYARGVVRVKRGEIIIHAKDGRVVERESYAHGKKTVYTAAMSPEGETTYSMLS